MNAFDVFLNFGPESRYAEFFGHFSTVAELKNGNKIYRMECSQADDTTHHLAVVLAGQSKYAGIPLRIPHHMVLAVVDAGFPEKNLGFVSSAEPDS
jgi:hypothetical protein